MKNIVYTLAVALCFCSCAGKTSTTDAKKENGSVISVFGTTSAEKKKNSEAAADVLDSPKFVPTPGSQSPGSTNAPAETVVKNSPKEVIKSYTNELQTLKDDTSVKGKNRDKQIAQKVRRFFDFDSLARMSLDTHWDKLSPKKKAEYSDLFTRLIEKSYLKRSQTLVGNYQLSYGNEKMLGDKATVACEIYKDDVDLEIIYELHKVTSTWMIYNIIFDQVNLVKNYQTQFNQIIGKSGIDGLMDMMRKKLKENNSDVDAAL